MNYLISRPLLRQIAPLGRRTLLSAGTVLFLLLPASTAYAQADGDKKFFSVLAQGTTLGLLGGGVVGGYLLSCVLTMLLLKRGYPPNIARLACWIGSLLFLVYALFIVFGFLAPATIPGWLFYTLVFLLVVFGIVLFVTRKQLSA